MLRLSTSDVDLLEAALHTLLSPLAYDRIEQWADAVLRVFQPLFQFDQALFGLALGGTLVAQGYGERTAEAARTYAEHFWTVDPGMTELRKIRRLEVYHRDDIYDRHAQKSAEIFADWCTPNKLLDPAGMSVDLGMVYPAALHIYHDTESHRRFGKRGLALLRLLLPAYKAGVLTAVRFQNRSATLLAQIDDRGGRTRTGGYRRRGRALQSPSNGLSCERCAGGRGEARDRVCRRRRGSHSARERRQEPSCQSGSARVARRANPQREVSAARRSARTGSDRRRSRRDRCGRALG